MTISKENEIMTQRVYETLADNQESLDEINMPKESDEAYRLLTDLKYGYILSLREVVNFANSYNVSIDWLLGRTDKEWL